MRSCVGLVVALLVAGTGAVRGEQPGACDRYYIVVFGTQSVPYRIRYTHTWATFVKTTTADGAETVAAVDTISWLPATLKVRPLAVRPEVGVNLTLAQTQAVVADFGGRVSLWGPYPIDAEHYANVITRKHDLEAGAYLYRGMGGCTKDSFVSNCAQAYTRPVPVLGQRYLQPCPWAGEGPTGVLVERYVKAGAISDSSTADWLLPAIGADRYPYTRRQPGEWVPLLRPGK